MDTEVYLGHCIFNVKVLLIIWIGLCLLRLRYHQWWAPPYVLFFSFSNCRHTWRFLMVWNSLPLFLEMISCVFRLNIFGLHYFFLFTLRSKLHVSFGLRFCVREINCEIIILLKVTRAALMVPILFLKNTWLYRRISWVIGLFIGVNILFLQLILLFILVCFHQHLKDWRFLVQ